MTAVSRLAVGGPPWQEDAARKTQKFCILVLNVWVLLNVNLPKHRRQTKRETTRPASMTSTTGADKAVARLCVRGVTWKRNWVGSPFPRPGGANATHLMPKTWINPSEWTMESVPTEKQLLLQVCDRLASGHLLGGRGQDRGTLSGKDKRSRTPRPGWLKQFLKAIYLMSPTHAMAAGFFALASLLCPLARVLLAQVPQEPLIRLQPPFFKQCAAHLVLKRSWWRPIFFCNFYLCWHAPGCCLRSWCVSAQSCSLTCVSCAADMFSTESIAPAKKGESV